MSKKIDINEIIDLNVGGRVYTTLCSTLGKYPKSLLGAMFNGKHELRTDSKGRVFIDRDGKLFRYIINFLRCEEIKLPESIEEREQLKIEAEYYKIQPLIDLLSAESDVQSRARVPLTTKTLQRMARAGGAIDDQWLTVIWENAPGCQGFVRVTGKFGELSAFKEDKKNAIFIPRRFLHKSYVEEAGVFSTLYQSYLKDPEIVFVLLRESGYHVVDCSEHHEFINGKWTLKGELWRFTKSCKSC